MNEMRKASLLLEGQSQVIKVPQGFELPGTEVKITKDGDRLIIEPSGGMHDDPKRLAALLDSWEPLTEEDWPDIDDSDLGPLRDVEL